MQGGECDSYTCVQASAASSDGWWDFESPTALAEGDRESMSNLPVSYSRAPSRYSPDFQIDMDPGYRLPAEMDARQTLIPFSPPFSPLSLHAALDSDTNFCGDRSDCGTRDDGKYWMDHPQLDPILNSPQWSAIHTPRPDSWGAMMVPAHGGSNDVPPYPPFDFTLPLSQIVPQLSSPSELSSLSPSSASASRASSSRRSSIEAVPKCCSHCEATTTPLWRRHPATHEPLCNACGLYLQQRHKMRPRVLIAAEQEEDELPLDESGLGPECSHCHARKTSVWRRSKSGAKLCNACGVYARLRGRDRPLSLRRNKIRPRCKHSRT